MQTVFWGISHLKEAMAGLSKALIVCDYSFSSLNICESIESIPIPKIYFKNFSSNPHYESVCEGVRVFNDEHCDSLLAVGGGSAIDVAKCIKLFCRLSKDDIYLNQPYSDTGIKLIAIPTTAGTGSESTRFAVVYYEGKKQSITHDSIVPDYAILEPSVLKSLPLYQKKCTMMDALCQGIESWWSVNSTDKSKQYSKIVVETIIQNWEDYIFHNSDNAAEKIMQAANYSGRAICITQTTAPHAFSYKITSIYGFPHGHSVAVCLPPIWTYMLNNPENCVDKRGIKYLSDIFYDISKSMGVDTPHKAIEYFKEMLEKMELKSPRGGDYDSEIDI